MLLSVEGCSALSTPFLFFIICICVASGSDDGTVRLWDATTRALHRTLEGHSNWVGAVAFSPDGRLVASGSGDGTVQLWDATTRALHRTLEGHSAGVGAVAFSPDGRLVASGSGDGTVRLWDAITEELVQQFDVKGVTEIYFSVDGSILVTNCGQIQLTPFIDHTQAQLSSSSSWRLEEKWLIWGTHKKLWLPHDFPAFCSAAWGNLLVIGCRSGRLWFIEPDSGFD